MTFNKFYIQWYSRMQSFACEYVLSEKDAEDIVQDIFTELYGNYAMLDSRVNLVAYLFTTIKNRCIDHLRKKIREQETAGRIQEEYLLTLRMKFDSLEILDTDLFNEHNVEQIIQKALDALPKRCREIFIKHKIEGKKHKEIALELGITSKTVENQIGIAYRKLRVELKNHALLFSFLL